MHRRLTRRRRFRPYKVAHGEKVGLVEQAHISISACSLPHTHCQQTCGLFLLFRPGHTLKSPLPLQNLPIKRRHHPMTERVQVGPSSPSASLSTYAPSQRRRYDGWRYRQRTSHLSKRIPVCRHRRLTARYRRMQASDTKTELESELGIVTQTEVLKVSGLETPPPH